MRRSQGLGDWSLPSGNRATPGPVDGGMPEPGAATRPDGRGNQPGAAGRLERELAAWRPARGGVAPREIDCVRSHY